MKQRGRGTLAALITLALVLASAVGLYFAGAQDLAQVVVGGALAITGGIIVARYQAGQTEELARHMRRIERQEEREENALLDLQPMLPTRQQIDTMRWAVTGDDGGRMAGAWEEIGRSLPLVSEAWGTDEPLDPVTGRPGTASIRVSSHEIRAAIDRVLGVRDWFDRRIEYTQRDSGHLSRHPDGVDDIERFRRAGTRMVADLLRVHDLIEQRLR